MMFKKILLLLSLLIVVSCGEDNDDIVLPNDVSNIDFATDGIIFGRIKRSGCTADCNLILKYTNDGVFLSTDTTGLPTEWSFEVCPLPLIASVDNKDIVNVPRGLRDIPSTTPTLEGNTSDLFIIEYIAGTKKTIQFTNSNNIFSERIKTYFDYIRSRVALFERAPLVPPVTCP